MGTVGLDRFLRVYDTSKTHSSQIDSISGNSKTDCSSKLICSAYLKNRLNCCIMADSEFKIPKVRKEKKRGDIGDNDTVNKNVNFDSDEDDEDDEDNENNDDDSGDGDEGLEGSEGDSNDDDDDEDDEDDDDEEDEEDEEEEDEVGAHEDDDSDDDSQGSDEDEDNKKPVGRGGSKSE